MIYKVAYTPEVKATLAAIRDVRVRRSLLERAEELAHDPNLQGKPLGKELKGFRSVRAVGQRFRIIYQVKDQEVMVIVIGIGRRREGAKGDVYEQVEYLVRSGKIKPD